MIKKLIKLLVAILGGLVGYAVFRLVDLIFSLTGNEGFGIGLNDNEMLGVAIIFAIIFGLLFLTMIPVFRKQGKIAAATIETELKGVSSTDMISGVIGLVTGLLIASFIVTIYEAIQVPWLTLTLTVVTYMLFAYLGIVIATKKGPDLFTTLASYRRTQTTSGKSKKTGDATPKILDTSVIIDGRIADIMKTGFIEGRIIIPEFVLVELRHIADSSDSLKRQRGRRGLDILNKIQIDYGIEIYNTTGEKSLEEIPEVDVKLLKLAQIMNGKVVTNDFNLNKVAAIKGVDVLNINELANTLKPVVLPGETMQLFLVKEGKEFDQAVAYLDDGTMIVVEDGRKFIGQTIEVTVTSVLQTAAGRMIFGKPKK